MQADLGNADLRGADLELASLEGANLEGADLEGANLEEARLTNSRLIDVDLRKTNLTDADLFGGVLRGAKLGGNKTVSSYNLAYAEGRQAELDNSQKDKVVYWENLNPFVEAIARHDSTYSSNEVEYHIVIESHTGSERAINRAKELRAKPVDSEVYYSKRGYYAVTIGSVVGREKARQTLQEAIDDGIARSDSYLSRGGLYREQIFPTNSN